MNVKAGEKDEYIRLLAKMSDDAPVSITVHDFDGNILYANEETFRLHGFTCEEFLAKNLHEIDVPESEKLIAARIQQIREKGEADFEVRHFKKDGSIIPLHTNVKIVDWEGKKVLLSIATDLTERKRAEEKLKKTKNEFSSLIRNSADIIAVLDPNGKFLFLSPSFYTTLGFNEEKTRIKNAFELIHPDDAPLARKTMQLSGENPGKIHSVELRMHHEDGSWRIMDVKGTMSSWGEHDRVIIINGRDITGRKLAEETQQASEIRYRRLFETAQDGILILDAETGQIVEVNPYFIKMLGFSREQFLGKKIWEIGLFKDILANKENFEKLQKKKYMRYENLPIQTAEGMTIAVEFVSNVYKVNEKKVIQCNIRDITERKLAENQIRILNEKLTAESIGLNKTQNELNALNTQLESLVKKRTAELEKVNLMLTERNITLKLMNAGARALLIVQDEAGFIPQICNEFILTGEYSHVWLAGIDQEGKVGIAGTTGDEYPGFSKMLAEGKLPACTDSVLKVGGIKIIVTPDSACAGCPLSQLHTDCYTIVVRLDAGEKTVGMLGVTLRHEMSSTNQETERIRQIAQEIAFVILYLRTKGREQAAYNQITKNLEQFAILNDHIRNPLQGIVGYAGMGEGELFT
ncbi:MAG: PAS domain-containing protein, partial [Methanomicrobiaceae archaeon]|nr:PAS domain-containing protein [Methanomicrobiaceae archaeon]